MYQQVKHSKILLSSHTVHLGVLYTYHNLRRTLIYISIIM